MLDFYCFLMGFCSLIGNKKTIWREKSKRGKVHAKFGSVQKGFVGVDVGAFYGAIFS